MNRFRRSQVQVEWEGEKEMESSDRELANNAKAISQSIFESWDTQEWQKVGRSRSRNRPSPASSRSHSNHLPLDCFWDPCTWHSAYRLMKQPKTPF